MKNISDIIDKIKKEMMKRNGVYGVPLNKQVAKELLITPNRLAIHKKRGTIPFVKVMNWCKDNNVSMKEMFYGGAK